jgi:hypothetical protein
MEDKVTLFGNVAHNIAVEVEELLLNVEGFSPDPIAEIAELAVNDLALLEQWIKNNLIHAIPRALEALAKFGMAGHQYALDGQTHVSGLANKMTDLYARKNRDYGNSFDKSMDKFGLVVAAIRIGDKVNRLQSLVAKRGEAEVKDESLADTFMDLACYSIMTMLWLHDKK